jgi:hypothetical protein
MFARSGPTRKSHVPMTKLCKLYFRLLHAKAIAEKADEHFLVPIAWCFFTDDFRVGNFLVTFS